MRFSRKNRHTGHFAIAERLPRGHHEIRGVFDAPHRCFAAAAFVLVGLPDLFEGFGFACFEGLDFASLGYFLVAEVSVEKVDTAADLEGYVLKNEVDGDYYCKFCGAQHKFRHVVAKHVMLRSKFPSCDRITKCRNAQRAHISSFHNKKIKRDMSSV